VKIAKKFLIYQLVANIYYYKPKNDKIQLTQICKNCKAKNAIIGDMSSIPPIGGIIPLNIFKNGSVKERIKSNG
jgi:hypothetical protein